MIKQVENVNFTFDSNTIFTNKDPNQLVITPKSKNISIDIQFESFLENLKNNIKSQQNNLILEIKPLGENKFKLNISNIDIESSQKTYVINLDFSYTIKEEKKDINLKLIL